jgi:uncharacterized protein YkwD
VHKRSARSRRVAVGALALALLTSALVATQTAGASTPAPPTVTAKFSIANATVTWSIASTAKVKGRVVELQRANAGGAFTTIATKNNAGRKGSVKDTGITTRFASYRARATVAGVASAWSAPITLDTFGPLEAGTTDCDPNWTAQGIVEWNKWRAAVGVDASQRQPIKEHIGLARLARQRASHIARLGRLTHAGFSTGLLAKWGSPEAKSWGAGENMLALGGPKEAILGWAGSTGHRANQIRRTNVGALGCARDEDGVPFWVMIVAGFVLVPS